jgi:hypothetical protein
MTTDDIIIRVTRAFLWPYPMLAGKVVLLSGPARIGRQVQLYLTPTTPKSLTLESEVHLGRFDPNEGPRAFTYSGATIDPSEIQDEAWLTTMSYEEARRYSEQQPTSEPKTAAKAGSLPSSQQPGG